MLYLLRFFSFEFSCGDTFSFLAKVHVPLDIFYESCLFSQITFITLNYCHLQDIAGLAADGRKIVS